MTRTSAQNMDVWRRSLAALLGACLAPCGGPVQQSTAQPVEASIPAEHSSPPADLNAREYWESLLIAGQKVGFRRTNMTTTQHDAATFLEISATEQLWIQRGGETLVVRIDTQSRELAEGTVKSCAWEERIGPVAESPQSIRRARGTVSDGQILWEMSNGSAASGQPIQFCTAWQAGGGGFFALAQSLRCKPMQPGEERRVLELTPLLNAFVTSELNARKIESTDLGSSRRPLLRIDAVAELPSGARLRSILWADENGEILKSAQPALKLVTYRTGQQDAQQVASNPADLFTELMVPIRPEIVDAQELDQLVYEIALATGETSRAFSSDDRQRWMVLSDRRARLTVSARRPEYWRESREARHGDESPRPALALLPSELIDFEAPVVQQLAARAIDDSRDSWGLARKLERLVYETIAEKNFESAMAPASRVAKSGEGDCTEHAVLLAALCRAVEIPARVAVGLVYVESAGGFLYHMWNEVWIDGGWRPLDATSSRGGVGATHLKITDSLLDEQNVYASLLPVLNVIGQARIWVVDE